MATSAATSTDMIAGLPLGLPLDLSFLGAPWDLPLAFIFFAGALLLLAVNNGRLRTVILLATPVVGALNILTLGPGELWTAALAGFDLSMLRVDRLSLLFGYIFHIAAFFGVLYGFSSFGNCWH